MELSVGLPPSPRNVEYAVLAEELGYARVWLYDSPALYGDVWMALTEVALRTARVGIGPAVLVPSLRHVMANAAAIATMERLAPGRAIAAVGTGFTGRMVLGQRPMPWADVEDYVRTLRDLLAGKDAEVEGAVVRMIHPDGFSPARPITTPIIVAANGPRGLRVARELGDGVMAIGALGPPSGFDWCSVLVYGTVLDEGEPVDSERVIDAAGPALSVVYHAVWEGDPAGVDGFPGGQAWRAAVEAVPERERHLAVHEGHFAYLNDRDRAVLDPSMITSFTWTGSREDVAARIAGAGAAGATEILYAPMGPDIPRELRAFAEAFSAAQT